MRHKFISCMYNYHNIFVQIKAVFMSSSLYSPYKWVIHDCCKSEGSWYLFQTTGYLKYVLLGISGEGFWYYRILRDNYNRLCCRMKWFSENWSWLLRGPPQMECSVLELHVRIQYNTVPIGCYVMFSGWPIWISKRELSHSIGFLYIIFMFISSFFIM